LVDSVARASIVKGTLVLLPNCLAELRVTIPVFMICTPPVPATRGNHSAPAANGEAELYCRVALVPYVGAPEIAKLLSPSIERIPLTVKLAVVIVFKPVPPNVTLLKLVAPTIV